MENKESFFKSYFTYNNEKISGSTYFIRLLLWIPLVFLFILPGIYWLGIISFKRGKALGWSNTTCYVISTLFALTPFIIVTLPLHFVLWFGMFKKSPIVKPSIVEKKYDQEETSYPLKSVAEENPSPNQKISAIKTKKKESNGLRKFKFFLIYFVVFWIQAIVVVFISLTVIGPRPSGLIAFGSLLSFWTSYKITKAIMSRYFK